MLPSLNALRAFDQAARSGSFRAAAEALNVSPTAISHHIRGLEDHLGVQLFSRDGRRSRLTPQGAALAKDVAEGFAQLTQAVARMRRSRDQGVVRIATGPFFAARWLMPRLAEFWLEHPEIALEVVTVPRTSAASDLDADLVVTWDAPETARATPLLTLTPVPIASPALLARLGRPASPAALASYPLIHQRDGTGWTDWFAGQGITLPHPPGGAIFEDANVVLRGALEGQGVTLGWLPLIASEIDAGRVDVLFDGPVTSHKHYSLTDAPRAVRSEAHLAVRDWLVRTAGQTTPTRPAAAP